MGAVLSQSEIDQLLADMNTEPEKFENPSAVKSLDNIKEYNFARPPKFNKEHLRTLEVIFDNYARNVTGFLTAHLRANVSMEVFKAEQVTYGEFSDQLQTHIILALVDFLPLDGTIVINMSAEIGFAIIDRVLGGSGVGIKTLREFSEIEKVLLKRILTQMTQYLIGAWENVVDLKPKLDKIETNAQFAQIISPNEMISLVTLNIKVGDVEGYINFAIPHVVVKPVIERLNLRYWFVTPESQNEDDHRNDVETNIQDASLQVKAVIGKSLITVDEFIDLQVGDVIQLDSFVDQDIEIRVGNLHKFNAKPGIVKSKKAIQITDIIGRGKE